MFKGENPAYVILSKNKINIGLYSDIYRPTSFKLGIITEPTKIYILMSVSMSTPSHLDRLEIAVPVGWVLNTKH